MNYSKKAFAAQHQNLSDSELLRRVQSGTMVPLALEAACEELRSRGIEIESPMEQGDLQGPDAEFDTMTDRSNEEESIGFDFVTIARLVNPVRANLLRAHLQSEDITVHLLGEHLGVVDLFLSAGSGGIHVQVRRSQLDRAREILNEFDRIEQTVGETIGDEPEELLQGDSKRKGFDTNEQRYSPPKSYVADVELAQKRREYINRPTSAIFFWVFASIMIGMVLYILATSA